MMMFVHIGRNAGALTAVVLVAAWLLVLPLQSAMAQGNPEAESALDAIDSLLDQAKDLRANKNLPRAWQTARAALEDAKDLIGEDGVIRDRLVWERRRDDAEFLARQLLAKAEFVEDMRRQKSAHESMMKAYDMAIRDCARAADLPLDPELVGPAAGVDLARRLGDLCLVRTMAIDSLRIAARGFEARLNNIAAEHDSVVTGLVVEASALRDQLWQMQLRAGVAEADRSAAEDLLERRRRHEQMIRDIGSSFSPSEAEMLLTTDGDVIIRVYGFAFAVGSSELEAPGSLVDKLAAAITAFPDRKLRVEGHTDNTGSRNSNLRLSRRRAETVARMLQGKLDLPIERVEIIGFGPDKPIATNETAAGRTLNRRIDVLLLSDD